MQAVADGHNVVIRGAWNRNIFNPVWVDQQLASGAGVSVEMAFGNPALPLRLMFGGLSLTVSSDLLIVGMAEVTPTSLGAVQSTAVGILETLSHTPVSAVGVNFRFNDPDPDAAVLAVLELSDEEQAGFTEAD